MTRVLLVGFGRWGAQHLRVLRELGVDLWVADAAADRRAAAVALGVDPVRVVPDQRAALDRVDAVDIVSPADTHFALAAECLAASRPCFVEKPLVATVGEARRLQQWVGETGRLLQVGHVFRFHPVSDWLRAALAAGTIGLVRYATGRLAGFKRPRTDVGVTQTDSIHFFDLFAYLLGREATAVSATLRDHLGRGLDDVSFAVVEYGATPAVVEAGYLVPGKHQDCVVVGECGSLVADFGLWTVAVHRSELRRRSDGWEAVEHGVEEVKVSGDEPLRRELAAFLESVEHGGAPAVDVTAGLRALEVVAAAARSSRLGRRVTLSEVRAGI